MVNNIQPRLSKIGKSLSFQNNKSISSGDNGFALTNNDGTAANLNTGDISVGSASASGLIKSTNNSNIYSSSNLLAQRSLNLNIVEIPTNFNTGIKVATGTMQSSDVVVSGKNTNTVSLSINPDKISSLNSIVIVSEFLYTSVYIIGCSRIEEIVKILLQQDNIKNSFTITYTPSDIIFSAKNGAIIEDIVCYEYVYKGIELDSTQQWVINDTIVIGENRIASKNNLYLGGTQVLLDEDYTPNSNNSLVTKKFVEASLLQNLKYPKNAGCSLISGKLYIDMTKEGTFTDTHPDGDFSIVFPYFKASASFRLLTIKYKDNDYFYIDVIQNEDSAELQIFVAGSKKGSPININFNDYNQISICYDDGAMSLSIYNAGILIGTIPDTKVIFENVDLFELFDNGNTVSPIDISGELCFFNSYIDAHNIIKRLQSSLMCPYRNIGAYFKPITSGTLTKGKQYELMYDGGDFSSCGLSNVTGNYICTKSGQPNWGNSTIILYGAVIYLQFSKELDKGVVTDISHRRNAIPTGVFNFNTNNNIEVD